MNNSNPLSSLSVLVVEDQEDIRETLSTLIGLWAQSVQSAANGQEGYEAYQKFSPDIIITDIRMPVMSGLEMIRQIKAHNPTFPVLITTAFQDPEYLLDAIELKVDGYIVKPIRKKDLKNRLELVAKSLLYEAESAKRLQEQRLYQEKLAQQNQKLFDAQRNLHHQAHHDTLTNLPNRLLFLDRLNQTIKHAKRYEKQLAVLFMDLDHFKEINDTLGHDAGDQLLITVARKLESAIRKSDTVARLGGDEFTLILEDIEESNDIITITQKILYLMTQPVSIEDNEFYTSFSIGIALYPNDGESAETLLKNADAAMYRVKEEGRNNYQFYTEDMTTRAFERMHLETQLRKAIENHEFELYYQAQLDLSSQKIIGMEALIRWNHPNLGIVPPSQFIPLAEDTGLIIQIDDWVMEKGIVQWVEWLKKGIDPGKLSLNLSQLQLDTPNFIKKVTNLIDNYQIDPHKIIFEVTESQIMKNPKKAIKILQELSTLGIELAIDDFGTGYSSLSYLKQLPINKLKIDQSFIHDIPQDMDDMEITRTIIAMSKGLHLDIIAEGVETKEQSEFLTENGCNEVQGFYYHKPASKKDIEKFLLKYL